MKNSVFQAFITILIFNFIFATNEEQQERVKLSDISVITLYRDKLSNARRLPPMPQLRCINTYGNTKCSMYQPSVVQCFNKGYDGIYINWECESDLNKTIQFGEIRVTCEGYDHPGDAFILEGSCALEYTLVLNKSSKFYDINNRNMYEVSKLSNLFTLIIMIFIILAVYKSCNKNREADTVRRELGSYAIVEHTDSNFNIDTASNCIYPPPPPPYGYTVANELPEISKPVEITTQTIPPPSLPSLLQPQPPSTTNNFFNGNLMGGGGAVSGITGYFLNLSNSSRQTNPTTSRSSSPPPVYESN